MSSVSVNIDKLLLESGSFMLLETGDKILLGSTTLTINEGVFAVGTVGPIQIAGWTLVNDAQGATWIDVNDAQGATWITVDTGG